jgi:hypothetical protein
MRNTKKRNITKRNITKKKHHIKSKKNKFPPFPIDIVYTWKGEDFSNDRRLSNNNELKYSLRSVELNAPWVNKIFILMNNSKIPSWINPTDKIIILEHTDTFPSKKYLPNINSNAIESTIANIPDLSEHYIYLNDDIFLGKKTKYTDFFTPDGKAIIDKIAKNRTKKYIENNLKKMNNNFKLNLNTKLPPNCNTLSKHIPFPQIKSIVLKFNKEYAHYIHQLRSTKKRRPGNLLYQQIHCPISKYMLLKNKAVTRNFSNKHVDIRSSDKILSINLKKILRNKPNFFCIKDEEDVPLNRQIVREKLTSFLESYYPNKATFEK